MQSICQLYVKTIFSGTTTFKGLAGAYGINVEGDRMYYRPRATKLDKVSYRRLNCNFVIDFQVSVL